MKKLVLFVLTINFMSINLFSTNYYVSENTGNDANNGQTPTTAKKTFNQVNYGVTLSPGDTIFIMNGTYISRNGRTLINLKGRGTKTNPIVYTNYKNHRPVFKYVHPSSTITDPLELDRQTPWHLIGNNGNVAQFMVIEGLTLEGNNEFLTEEDAIKQNNNCINNTDGDGARTDKIFNVDGFGIYKQGSPHHITIRNCKISNFPGGGVACVGVDYLTVENCEVFNNGWYAVDGNSGISTVHAPNSDNHPGTDFTNIVRNNLVYNNINYLPWNGICKYSDGNGIIIDNFGAGYTGRTLVENNICYDNGGGGIQFFKTPNGVVRNNTLYRNSKQGGGYGFAGYDGGELSLFGSRNVEVYNNIIVPRNGKKSINRAFLEGLDETNRTGYNFITSFRNGSDVINQSTDILNQDPQFINPDANDFRIRCSSPARNAGTRATGLFSTTDYFGRTRLDIDGQPDMGAHEAACGVVNDPEAIIISEENSFCSGSSLELIATAGSSYQWFRNEEVVGGNTQVYVANLPGDYQVRVFYASGNASTSAIKQVERIYCEEKGPYSGTPIAVPGTIEMENYDLGGPGVSFSDTDEGNNGSAYRTDDVDLAGANGDYVVGWMVRGEWLEYTVSTAESGVYNMEIIYASQQKIGAISILENGSSILGNTQLPLTGGWTNYQSGNVRVNLKAGVNVLRFNIVEQGFNIDKIIVTPETVTHVTSGINTTELEVYPNPSYNGLFHINRSQGYEVYDTRGDLINTGNSSEIDLSEEPSGVYLLHVDNTIIKLVK